MTNKSPEHAPEENSELARPTAREALLVALALVAGPFLITPLVLHSANTLNFSVDLFRALSGPAILAMVFGLLAFIAMRYLGRTSSRLAVMLLAVAYLFWIQGHLLVWDYGALDGRAIDWSGQWLRGLLDGALWVLGLGIAWVACDRLRPQLGMLATVLLGIYLITGVSTWLSREPAPAFHRYALDETHKYDFSQSDNVILIVADAFQSDLFQELLDTRPDLFGAFDGFTYYRNATSGFAKTYPSVPLMLTGQWYDNATPVTQFVESAYLNHSVTTDMIGEGWRVDLFPYIPRVIHHDDRVASNIVEKGNPVDLATESGRLADLSLFRVSPHFFKAFWLNDDQWRLSPAWAAWAESRQSGPALRQVAHANDAARFALSAKEYGRATWETPAFKLYHLMVPHEPFLLREDFSIKRWPAGREGFLGQSAATLRVLETFIDSLKGLDLYDDATIVVVADHGGGDYNAGVRTGNVVNLESTTGTPAMSSQYHASALPLVLIKPRNAKGALELSDTAVSIGDVAATLAEAAGTPGKSGQSMLDASTRNPDSQSEARRYYFYRHSGWSGEYLPPMEEFEVIGHSWRMGDWAATGRIIAPGGEIQRARGYEPGTRVRFNGEGQASTWLSSGWSGSEAGGTWTADRTATLRIPLAEPRTKDNPTHAHFWLKPFLAGGQLTTQQVTLIQDDKPIANWNVGSSACYSAPLRWSPSDDADSLPLAWELPDAAAPNDFGISGDFRLLGIYLEAMELGASKSLPLSENLMRLLPKERECAMRWQGWNLSDGLLLSTRPESSLLLQVNDSSELKERGATLTFDLEPWLGERRLTQQRMIIRSKESVLAEWTLEKRVSQELSLTPGHVAGGVIDLHFEFPDATSPNALGINSDQRKLGVMVKGLSITVSE